MSYSVRGKIETERNRKSQSSIKVHHTCWALFPDGGYIFTIFSIDLVSAAGKM